MSCLFIHVHFTTKLHFQSVSRNYPGLKVPPVPSESRVGTVGPMKRKFEEGSSSSVEAHLVSCSPFQPQYEPEETLKETFQDGFKKGLGAHNSIDRGYNPSHLIDRGSNSIYN